MIEINKNIVFVQGSHAGAIYNLNSGDVFSINNSSCDAIHKYIEGAEFNNGEKEYIDLLIANNLIDEKFVFSDYIPTPPACTLDLCWLEITQACNCRCVHCYEGDNHIKQKNPLSLKEWKKLIDQIKNCGVKRVVIIGGEPCVHPHINEIAEYVSSKKINTTIFTNGTHITDSLKEIVIKNKIKMKFSLYGHCAEIHDCITKNKGSFDKLTENIRYFLEHKITVDVAVVIMRENENYINEIKDFLNELGVSKYRFDVIREAFCGNQSTHIPLVQEVIDSVKRNRPSFSKITKEKFDAACFRNTCWNGKIVICEDGNVLPCVFARNISLGNIKNNTIDKIILAEETQKCWNMTFDNVEGCSNCEFRFACKDCRPLAEASSGYRAKNPRCTYDVYSGEWK